MKQKSPGFPRDHFAPAFKLDNFYSTKCPSKMSILLYIASRWLLTLAAIFLLIEYLGGQPTGYRCRGHQGSIISGQESGPLALTCGPQTKERCNGCAAIRVDSCF